MQTWFKANPYGVLPRGNCSDSAELCARRFGDLSLPFLSAADETNATELFLNLCSYFSVPDLCRLSRTSTGWYIFLHASDAFKNAYFAISMRRLQFHDSWKETAVTAYIQQQQEEECHSKNVGGGAVPENGSIAPPNDRHLHHKAVRVSRPLYCDYLFQAWMCTILPCGYHLRTAREGTRAQPLYSSRLLPVARRSNLSPDEFRDQYETPNIPVVMTDIATKWKFFEILNGDFKNLSTKRSQLFREGVDVDTPLRCEHTTMNMEEYVRYALEQHDERPIYLFDCDFPNIMTEDLYTVPEHFSRDDYFSVLGPKRPKYRWIIAGPHRGGSSFHVDPNYTNAWNANLTGRKRWLLFPPGFTPPGVYPSDRMEDVTTPVSLTEWFLNHYDSATEQLSSVGYECICEPGDIMFVPCGWWHAVINLEDSVAITQNYVSRCNLGKVLKFLQVMKTSISGVDEDADDATDETTRKRQIQLGEQFAAGMRAHHPEVMKEVCATLEEEHRQWEEKKKNAPKALPLLDESESNGFAFAF